MLVTVFDEDDRPKLRKCLARARRCRSQCVDLPRRHIRHPGDEAERPVLLPDPAVHDACLLAACPVQLVPHLLRDEGTNVLGENDEGGRAGGDEGHTGEEQEA